MADKDDRDRRLEETQKKQEMEQAIALMADYLPRVWWSMFERCKEQGFTDPQAMELVKTFILSKYGTS